MQVFGVCVHLTTSLNSSMMLIQAIRLFVLGESIEISYKTVCATTIKNYYILEHHYHVFRVEMKDE